MKKIKDPFHIEGGELVFRDRYDGLRCGLLNQSKHLLYSLADTVGAMQCEGFLKDEPAVKRAIDTLNAQLLREYTFQAKPYGKEGRFNLIKR